MRSSSLSPQNQLRSLHILQGILKIAKDSLIIFVPRKPAGKKRKASTLDGHVEQRHAERREKKNKLQREKWAREQELTKNNDEDAINRNEKKKKQRAESAARRQKAAKQGAGPSI